MAVQRASVLGHVQRTGSVFGRNVSTPQWITAGLGIMVLIVAGLITQSAWTILIVGLLTFGGWKLAGHTTVEGDSWVATRLARLSASRESRSGRSAWNRELGLPAAIGPVRELVLRPSGAYDDVAVSLLHHASKRGSWDKNSGVTAVLEIVGHGDGLRAVEDSNRSAARYGRLHSLLASGSSPVTQLDFETKVYPTNPAEEEAYYASLIDDRCPPSLRASMDQLSAQAASSSETYRSFLTVRLDKVAVEERHGDKVLDLDGFVGAVGDQLREVVRRVEAAEFDVVNVLNPAQVGAMVRNLYVPSFPLDVPAPLRRATDGWSWPYEVHPDYVLVRGPEVEDPMTGQKSSDWYHSVATIPLDAFPPHAVTGRWLAGLVTDVHPSPIRTIKVQQKLLSKRETRQRAISRLTSDRANMAADDKRARVSTGESEAAASVHQLILDDLTHEQAAGVQGLVHVAVSGRSEAELLTARQQMNEAAEEIGADRLKWHRHRHDLAMIQMCPLGKEV
ncbi:SCO6880 family protein [Aeromicrobium sp. CF4.19]|uniref:SCO6880 family protein n=1 Tax=Aeromicrobium sp. CF4.19 TaxID=3373082 RepID=UPI003EE54EA4